MLCYFPVFVISGNISTVLKKQTARRIFQNSRIFRLCMCQLYCKLSVMWIL